MKAFITGVTGFVGKHLADFLISQGIEVWGVSRSGISKELEGAKWKLLQLDLSDEEALTQTLDRLQPNVIFHLAGQSSVKASWEHKIETFDTNVLLTIRLLESIRKSKAKDATVLTIGSSEEYGLVKPEEIPINEETPLRPISPYGISKVTVYLLARQYHQSYGMRTIHVRPFNHIGPGQRPGFVTSDFARQICEIEAGIKQPVMEVGNLSAERDFLDVRDIVRAYHLIAVKGKAGEVYNVCSSTPVKIQSILDFFLQASTVEIEVKQSEKLIRPVDFPRYIGSNEKLAAEMNWQPTIPLSVSLTDILSYWRNSIQAQ
jgi:GDP-4-dehydro-6-deoxy-D-mannose reductase